MLCFQGNQAYTPDLNLETDLFPLAVHFYKVFRHLNSFVQVFKMFTYLPIVRGYTHRRRGTGGFHGWWCNSLRPPQTWWTPSHPTHTHVTPLLTCTYSHKCFQTCSHTHKSQRNLHVGGSTQRWIKPLPSGWAFVLSDWLFCGTQKN